MILSIVVLYSLLLLTSASIPTIPSTYLPSAPLGTMAVPYKRSPIAIVPCYGALGGTLYGIAQRASSIYDSGIEGNKKGSVRGLAANARGSLMLNKVLSSKFTLAYAGEDKIRLCDFSSSSSIGRSLRGYDFVFTGLGLTQREGKVTGNSYEKTPNDRCMEFQWDGGGCGVVGEGDAEIISAEENLGLLKRIVEGCVEDGGEGKHVVVVGSGIEELDRAGLEVLQRQLPNFTFIIPKGEIRKTPENGLIGSWTFEKGLSELLVAREVGSEEINMWLDGKGNDDNQDDGIIMVEDVALLALQIAMQLDPTKSRVLEVKSTGIPPPSDNGKKSLTKPKRSDKIWCSGQQYVISMLESMS